MAPEQDDLQSRIKSIIVERLFLDVEPDELDAGESLTDAHGIDSVRLFDVVVGLEEDFDISFEDDELTLDNFDTVQAITQRVTEKQTGS